MKYTVSEQHVEEEGQYIGLGAVDGSCSSTSVGGATANGTVLFVNSALHGRRGIGALWRACNFM